MQDGQVKAHKVKSSVSPGSGGMMRKSTRGSEDISETKRRR